MTAVTLPQNVNAWNTSNFFPELYQIGSAMADYLTSSSALNSCCFKLHASATLLFQGKDAEKQYIHYLSQQWFELIGELVKKN